MAQTATIRAMIPARVTGSTTAGARRLTLIAIGMILGVAIGAVGLAARAAFAPPSGAQQMFEDIRYAAMFTGRDSDAAVRKAKLRVHLLMHEFGMNRTRAAEYVARIMIEQSGGLCSGI